ncbi:sensor histidine kinase [Rhizomonospora bruguierae]|uniref:sensor histidine kinase n=1 Tax=Rhizomonospora bruguierae TaxID=1581705 RepID=UPI001BCD86BA|nr:HAMP domain-containing sensor histidine kinase [Micromonospora sp. NBRC 107566]
MTALVIEFLCALVFVRAVVAYLRTRDPLKRTLMWVFSALSGLVAFDLYRRLIGPPPPLVSGAAALLILAQPALTLHVISRLRPVPRWPRWAALAGFAVTASPLVFLPRPIPTGFVIAATGVFVVTAATAVAFLGRTAGRRTGTPRLRLRLVAAGTAATALALLVLAAGAVAPGVAPVTTVAARGVALAAAVAYLAAFLPPSFLRRLWSGAAAYAVSDRLLHRGAESPGSTWHRYAEAVRDLSGSDAAAVVAAAPDGGLVELAAPGLPAATGPLGSAADLTRLLHARQPVDVVPGLGESVPLAVAYGRRALARYVLAVPVPLPSGRPAALLLLDRYRNLFVEDDTRVLAGLGGQAAILAERSAVLAGQELLATELAASVTALRTANRAAKRDFLAASHELRTPLTAIIGFGDLMRAEPLENGDRRVPAQWVDAVLAGGQHLLRLVNDILDLATAEAGRLELHPRELVLPLAVGEATAALRPLVDRGGLRLSADLPALSVSVDPIRFRQILDNLLANAIRFTPAGGRITISARRAGADLMISVADTGPGIAAADRERVFEEFQQAGDQAAKVGGTGLGLALTRRLVEAHGGRIAVEATEGAGATFTVCLPGAVRETYSDVVPGRGRGGCRLNQADPASGRGVDQTPRERLGAAGGPPGREGHR